ncbi:MAG: autotransporter outer membrane beta-barrel domain-containing protein [Oleiphilus sp.]
MDGYQETNGGGFEVAFNDQDISSQLLTLGGQAQYALSYSWGVLMPSARFEIKNEFNDSQDAISGRFVFDATNTSFSITADDIDNLWYVFGTGVSAVFPHGLSAYVDFETTEGLNNIDLYTYSYGGRWEMSF